MANLARPVPRLAWAVAAACAVFKVLTLLVAGPYILDNDFIGLKGMLLDGPYGWLGTADLTGAGWRLDTWRMLGYPAVLAGIGAIFDNHWIAVAILVQFAGHAAVQLSIFRVTWLATGNQWAGAAAAFAFTTGEALLMDMSIYPDSLFSSLVALCLLSVAARWIEGKPPSLRIAAVMGASLAAAVLMKEFGLAMAVGLVLMVTAWARMTGLRWRRVAVCWVLIAAPVATVMAGYSAWNHHRSGHAFMTLGLRTSLLPPLAAMASMGVPVFDGDGPMDRIAREALAEVSIPPGRSAIDVIGQTHVMGRINYGLWECCAMDAHAINEMVSRRFTRILQEHPLAVARWALTANHGHFVGLWRPTRSLATLWDVHHQTTFNGPRTLIGRTDWPAVSALAFHAVDLLISAPLAIAAFLALPVWAVAGPLRGGSPRERRIAWALLWLLAAHLASVAINSAVNLEHRYLLSTMPGAEVAAFSMLALAWARLRG